MARSNHDADAPAGKLKMNRTKAEDLLSQQIEAGEEFVDTYYRAHDDLDYALGGFGSWDRENMIMLRDIFEGFGPARKYAEVGELTFDEDDYLSQKAVDFKAHVSACIDTLRALSKELFLYDEPDSVQPKQAPGIKTARLETPIAKTTSDVFIVHGRNEKWKQEIASFLKKGGANPIILHEKVSEGRTIIEKFEHYSNVAYSVVILTPDDVGGSKTDRDAKYHPRARQNVIFELGYFVGKNGRNRVCALYVKDVELPSDYEGVLYVPLEEGDSWKTELARELVAAGIPFDLQRAIRPNIPDVHLRRSGG